MTIQEWLEEYKESNNANIKKLVSNVERIIVPDKGGISNDTVVDDTDFSRKNEQYQAFLTDPRRI